MGFAMFHEEINARASRLIEQRCWDEGIGGIGAHKSKYMTRHMAVSPISHRTWDKEIAPKEEQGRSDVAQPRGCELRVTVPLMQTTSGLGLNPLG